MYSREVRTVIAVFIALPFAVGFSSSAPAASLNDAELSSAFIGKTLNVKTPKGTTGKITYRKNGTQKWSSKGFKDTGKWQIKSNKWCSTWKIIRKGKTKCFTITKIGNNKWKDNTGNILSY